MWSCWVASFGLRQFTDPAILRSRQRRRRGFGQESGGDVADHIECGGCWEWWISAPFGLPVDLALPPVVRPNVMVLPHRHQVSNGVFLDGPRRWRGGRFDP